MSPKIYSTGEAARLVGISRQTLQTWIAARKVEAPRLRMLKRVGARLWSEPDVARLRKAKQEIYGKGRGRKPKSKKRAAE